MVVPVFLCPFWKSWKPGLQVRFLRGLLFVSLTVGNEMEWQSNYPTFNVARFIGRLMTGKRKDWIIGI